MKHSSCLAFSFSALRLCCLTLFPCLRTGGLHVSIDGQDDGVVPFSEVPEDCQNITAVYYQMDRLVASATLPQQYAFRLPDGGKMLT